MSSSSESLPSSASSAIAAAVNCFETEPMSKTDDGVIGDAVLEVRHAVAAREHELAVLDDADRAARAIRSRSQTENIASIAGP